MSSAPDPLRDLLQTWPEYRPEPNADFNRMVWTRLSGEPAQKESSSNGWMHRLRFLSDSWSRGGLSLAATVLIVLSVALGSGAALAYDSLTRDQRMATAYAHTIDPLQMSARP